MAGKKLKAKLKAVIAPRPKGKPVKPRMTANSGLLTAKIIAVVEQKRGGEKAKKEAKTENS